MPFRPLLARGASSLAALLVAVLPAAVAHAQAATAADSVSLLTGIRVPTLSTGASVGVIDSAEIARSGARSLSELLMARIPGLSVRRRGGLAAEGSEVYSRGLTASTGADMMLIVDGILADGTQADVVPGTDATISRLDDLRPSDVQRIEVLRGSAAAALYGLGAGRGVIVVSTRRGAAGPLGFDVSAGTGLTTVAASFPANYQLTSGAPGAACNPRVVYGATSCTPTTLYSWNPLEQANPFRFGRATSARVALSGTALGTQTLLEMSSERAGGVTSNDWQSRVGVRANLSRELPKGLAIMAQGNYLKRDASVPGRGDNLTSDAVIGLGLYGSAYDDSLHGYLDPGPNQGRLVVPEPTTERVTSAVRLSWHALPWLDAEAVGGQDRVRQSARRVDPLTWSDWRQSSARGGRWTSGTLHVGTTVRYGGPANTLLSTGLSYDDARVRNSTTAGDSTIDSLGVTHGFSDSWREQWSRVQDAILRQHVGWREVLDINVGARWPVGRGIAAPLGRSGSRTADASLRLPRIGDDGEIRLRAAAGRSTLVPPGTIAFTGAGPTVFGGASPAYREVASRQGEIEGGIDATFGTRARMELTWYRGHALDVPLGSTSVAISTGYLGVPRFGDVDTHGIELLTSAQLLENGRFGWRATLTFATPRTSVVSTNPPAYAPGSGFDAGYSVESYWTRGYTWADTNGDGFIGRTEVQSDNLPYHYVGGFNPTVELGLRNAFTLPGRFTFGSLLDYRGGQYRSNQTEQDRCNWGICAGLQDPSLSLGEQARWMATARYLTDDIEPASFVRLRELTLTWDAPEPVARMAGGTALSLRLVGQNVATWTRYSGVDPEVSSPQPATRFSSVPVDRVQMPLPRSLSVELRLNTR